MARPVDDTRIAAIAAHPRFREQYALLRKAEEGREFCGHDMAHFLDVARLMYIYALEDGAALSRELIYAAALLHDIGRYAQLAAGTPHHIAGAALAGEILGDCGFAPEEIRRVQSAIAAHRAAPGGEDDALAAYLYRADKASRCCWDCPAAAACNWPEEKRNKSIDR